MLILQAMRVKFRRKDDGAIIKITATKTVEDIEEPFYEITIEGK